MVNMPQLEQSICCLIDGVGVETLKLRKQSMQLYSQGEDLHFSVTEEAQGSASLETKLPVLKASQEAIRDTSWLLIQRGCMSMS